MSAVERMPYMNDSKSTKKEKKFTGKHFLISILAFFGVIIGMNSVFVYFATNTWTGLSSDNAYMEGLNYNQTIDAASAQKTLNWQSSLEIISQGKQKSVVFSLKDKDLVDLSGFEVTATVGRPTVKEHDQTLVLAESSQGVYRANVELPLEGQWHVSLSATSPEGIPFKLEQRFFVK